MEFSKRNLELDTLQIGNLITLVKARMHEIQDTIENGTAPGDIGFIFDSYHKALDELNSAAPEGLRQLWVRS